MRATLGLVAALCLLGCGATASPRRGHRHSAPPSQDVTLPARSVTASPSATGAAPPSAAATVTAFATAYINWSAQTVSRDMRALAARSIGQARSAMQLAAAETASDYELQRGGIANTGTVEAVAPRRGDPDQYLVVTRELTSATATAAYQGLQPAWHVALVTVSQPEPGRWVVSGWQPES